MAPQPEPTLITVNYTRPPKIFDLYDFKLITPKSRSGIVPMDLATILASVGPPDECHATEEAQLFRRKIGREELYLNLDAYVLRAFLDNLPLLPEAWKNYGAIFFQQAIFYGPDGRHHMAYLFWDGGDTQQWYCHHRLLTRS